jgi:ABC-type sugar transport system permease subunit
MDLSKKSSIGNCILVGILLLALFYFLPLFIKGFSFNNFFVSLINNTENFSNSLVRSLIFATVSSLLNVILGFIIALLLTRITMNSFLGRQLSWFLLPVILGNVSVAFVFKISLFNTQFFNDVIQAGNYSHLSLLLLLQFWQFGFLFAYLFWINFQNLDKNKSDFGKTFKLNSWEKFRDILLPSSKNLGVLLFLIGFVFAFYENAKNQFIFKASQGTNTELISHWLERTYHSKLLINPDYAITYIFKNSLLVFIFSLFTFLILGLILNVFIQKISRSRVTYIVRRKISNLNFKRFRAIVFLLICLSTIFIPFAVVFSDIGIKLSKKISELSMPLALTLIAAALATILSIILAILSRIVFKKTLQDFNSKSLILFALLFVLLLIPSLAILLSGFQWLSWLGYNSNILIYFVWIVGHIILMSPLLISFLISIHFGIKGQEIEYISAYELSFKEIISNSFLKKFKAEYILTLIIACSFIWNEAVINVIFSDRIPSFAANLQMMFMGRAANYISAASYLMVSLLFAVICVTIWQKIIKKSNFTSE